MFLSYCVWVQRLRWKVVPLLLRAVQLHAAKVKATDLRAGAALVIAGLNGQNGGITEVTGVEYIDRGYDNFVYNLSYKSGCRSLARERGIDQITGNARSN